MGLKEDQLDLINKNSADGIAKLCKYSQLALSIISALLPPINESNQTKTTITNELEKLFNRIQKKKQQQQIPTRSLVNPMSIQDDEGYVLHYSIQTKNNTIS